VFGWIQGRGLEALAGHAAFLAGDADRTARADRILAGVAERIMALRERNHGRLFFLFTPEGRPFRPGADGRREYYDPAGTPPGFSDLFCAKGLAAAGARLRRQDLFASGVDAFRGAIAAIADGTFASDQVSFDPRNPSVPVPGRCAQGQWMIALGGFALLTELCPAEEEWVAGGAKFLRHLLARHVIAEASGPLRRFDFVEWTDVRGRPWNQEGKIVQDPGHAIEFTGLAARFLLKAAARGALAPELKDLLAECREKLPEVFDGAFANGFQRQAGGICKTFDLVARAPVNDDLPWWSLPETMRAAALLARLAPAHPKCGALMAAADACAQALFGRYRSPAPGVFVLTRNAQGEPTDTIPATPDVDPGYHGGLCLIDVVNACA
jgi:hypothetical protein